jgi:hypothetical protein
MLIVKIDSAYDLEQAFRRMAREKSFTRYDLLVQFYEDLDEDVELDVIALCGDWDEFATVEDYNHNYGTDYRTIEDISNDETVLFDDEKSAFIVATH